MSEIEQCRKLLEDGFLCMVKGGDMGFNATIKREGEGQYRYTLLRGSIVRKPFSSQPPIFINLFNQIQKTEYNSSLVILQENVSFGTLFDAGHFVVGEDPAWSGYQPWNLKKECITTKSVRQKFERCICYKSHPILLGFCIDTLCSTCLISFLNAIPDYCSTESEMIHELFKFMILYDEFFPDFPRMKVFFEDINAGSYLELINKMNEVFFNEEMYTTFVKLKNHQLQKTIYENLFHMQGKAHAHEPI